MLCHIMSSHLISCDSMHINGVQPSYKPNFAHLIQILPISIDVTYAPHQVLYKDDIPSSRILLIERGTVNIFSSEDLSLLSPYEIDRKLGEDKLVVGLPF